MTDQLELAKYIESVTDRALSGTGVGPTPARSLPTALDEHLRQAEHLADLDGLEQGTRMAGLKRLLLRLLRLITFKQTAFNVATTSAMRSLAVAQTGLGQRLARVEAVVTAAELAAEDRHEDIVRTVSRIEGALDDRFSRIERALDDRWADQVDRRLEDLEAEVSKRTASFLEEARADLDNLRTAMSGTRASLGELATAHARSSTEVHTMRTRVDMLLREARSRLGDPFDEDGLRLFARELEGRFDALYADYEARFRGPEPEIRKRLEVYVPDVLRADGIGRVMDIGPGRGEWLELLAANDIPAYGVELNEQFALACRERGLDVRVGDAVAHMHEVPARSLRAVTAFHVMEHLPINVVVDVIDASLLALEPGGCAIFETPNPTNLTVGAASFYLDPTHQRPLHPELMEFLMTSRGFCDVELRFLHPSEEVELGPPPGSGDASNEMQRMLRHVNWALFGPTDYGVIGWKAPVPTGR
jgi:SAM-dependent methyltransferase